MNFGAFLWKKKTLFLLWSSPFIFLFLLPEFEDDDAKKVVFHTTKLLNFKGLKITQSTFLNYIKRLDPQIIWCKMFGRAVSLVPRPTYWKMALSCLFFFEEKKGQIVGKGLFPSFSWVPGNFFYLKFNSVTSQSTFFVIILHGQTLNNRLNHQLPDRLFFSFDTFFTVERWIF